MLILIDMDVWAFNLRHLRAALETARLGSVNAAAQAVNLTQPAITQALAKLERQLGIALFERTATGMTPTIAAATLAPRIASALAQIASPRVTMAQMRALIALAAEGSYAAAARHTGHAQPSLHRSIADLSLALGRTLVERRGRGLTLTHQGRKAARAFRLAQAELEAGLSEIAALKGRETGRITVGAMPLSRARLLPHAVAAFHRLHPQIDVRIVEGSHAELIEPLRDGVLDMMIGALRDGDAGNDVSEHPLFEDRPVIIARAGHALAGQNGLPLSRLANYPWIVPAPGAPLRTQWERMFTEGGLPVPHVPIECGSVITIREILLRGEFLTLLSPDQVAVELKGGWLDRIGDAPIGLVRRIGVTTRTGWVPTALQRVFLTQLEGSQDD